MDTGRLAKRDILDAPAMNGRRILLGLAVTAMMTRGEAQQVRVGDATVTPSILTTKPSTSELGLEFAKPAKDLANKIGKQWTGTISQFAEICPVLTPLGNPSEYSVLIVRLDEAYKAGVFDKEPDLPVPDPVLLNSKYDVIGTFPEGFPVDPPGMLNVVFTDWVDGIPRVIRFAEAGNSALAPHPLAITLVYDAASGRFLPHGG